MTHFDFERARRAADDAFRAASADIAEQARQAALQADHERPYDHREPLFDPLADVSPALRCREAPSEVPIGTHAPQMVRELEGEDVIAALCGPMGRVA